LAPPAPPPSLRAIAAPVEARLSALLDTEVRRWSAVDDSLAEPLSSIRSLVLSGGKRLRPAFCHWAFVGAGGDPADGRVVDAGVALELLHSAALIHDDVIDSSPLRHGGPTVHRRFAAGHAQSKAKGDSRRFGEAAAILTGDVAFALANGLLAGASDAAHRILNELQLEVDMGQFLDLVGSTGADVTPERARVICRYKSGKYTVERPLHLGAALHGPAVLDRLQGPLSAFGLPLGEAFQLTDDLLDAFGDAAATGKPVGSDLREGKPTYLVGLARRSATGPAARLLAERYGATDLTDGEVADLQAVLVATGARAATEQLIGELVTAALDACEALPLSGDARSALAELARYVAGRDR
jgi:geranylgeranyl diphosphate synthase type I